MNKMYKLYWRIFNCALRDLHHIEASNIDHWRMLENENSIIECDVCGESMNMKFFDDYKEDLR